MLARRIAFLVLLVLCGPACGGGGGGGMPVDETEPPTGTPAGPEPTFARTLSPLEQDAPYIDDPQRFWARDDLFVMEPGAEPLDRWPDEVLFPSAHGVRIIVLLPGDYRTRSNGSLSPGTLYIEASGTAIDPLLVTFAPSRGADLRQTPHPAERLGGLEARLGGIRVWNQTYQYFRGLTFRDGVAASLIRNTSGTVIDRCLWHETSPQPLRIRFDAHHNIVQRCVFQRFEVDTWGHNDVVAIQTSDGACTHNHIVSNVILNYTDAYQHTDREGEAYGLGAGTLIDNNVMGFTVESRVVEAAGELMCGENTIDMKMGGTEQEPVVITNNLFFGVRAAKAGCAASGSGGYALTYHRRGTWIETRGNTFVDVDSGVFLNSFFQDVDPAQGRIDPHLTFEDNLFSGVRSFATAFPTRTGRVMSGLSPARFAGNRIVDTERLMDTEPFMGLGPLAITGNTFYGDVILDPRTRVELESDGNLFAGTEDVRVVTVRIPWVDRTLTYAVPGP